MIDSLDDLLVALKDGTDEVKIQAASSLTRAAVRDDRALASPLMRSLIQLELVKALEGGQNDNLRREAAFALGFWGDGSVVQILRKRAQDREGESVELRRTCATALGFIGGSEAVRSLCEIAKHDPAEAVRYDALDGLEVMMFVRKLDWSMERELILRTLGDIRDSRGEMAYLRRVASNVLDYISERP